MERAGRVREMVVGGLGLGFGFQFGVFIRVVLIKCALPTCFMKITKRWVLY